jgi:hypothetical protein
MYRRSVFNLTQRLFALTKNAKQAADNAGALTFSLTPAEIEALDQAMLAWRG